MSYQNGLCDRCGKKANPAIMSMYNTDWLCMDCKEKETKRPDYAQARDAEAEQVRQGNYNFEGVGL